MLKKTGNSAFLLLYLFFLSTLLPLVDAPFIRQLQRGQYSAATAGYLLCYLLYPLLFAWMVYQFCSKRAEFHPAAGWIGLGVLVIPLALPFVPPLYRTLYHLSPALCSALGSFTGSVYRLLPNIAVYAVLLAGREPVPQKNN